jgi:integrase/recombinase XerD
MTIDHVQVENSNCQREFKPAMRDKLAEIPKHGYFTESGTETPSQSKPPTHFIEKALQRLINNELCGQRYVRLYLFDLYRRNCSPNTIRGSFTTINLFLIFFKKSGGKYLETVTREDLSSFIENEQDRGLKPNSVRTRLILLKIFFIFLIERDVIHQDVLKSRMRIKIPDSLPRAIDPLDINHLLSVIKNIRDRAMILILLRTGMRIGELLSTSINDVNLKEKRIEIFEAQKNRVGRVVYLSNDAHVALKKWFKERDPQIMNLFYIQKRQSISYETARIIFVKYLAKAGLSHKGYTLHCLRHTFASELLNAGMRLECLQQLLGHSSIEITRRYARLTDNTRKEEYFKAMTIIERGDINGHYRFNPALS